MGETGSFVEKHFRRCVFVGIASILSLFVFVGYLQTSFNQETVPVKNLILSVLDNNRHGGGLIVHSTSQNGTLDASVLREQILQGTVDIKVVHFQREEGDDAQETALVRDESQAGLGSYQNQEQKTQDNDVQQRQDAPEDNIPQQRGEQPSVIKPSVVPVIGDTVKGLPNPANPALAGSSLPKAGLTTVVVCCSSML